MNKRHTDVILLRFCATFMSSRSSQTRYIYLRYFYFWPYCPKRCGIIAVKSPKRCGTIGIKFPKRCGTIAVKSPKRCGRIAYKISETLQEYFIQYCTGADIGRFLQHLRNITCNVSILHCNVLATSRQWSGAVWVILGNKNWWWSKVTKIKLPPSILYIGNKKNRSIDIGYTVTKKIPESILVMT